MPDIVNAVPQVGPRETITLANGKGAALTPNDPQSLGYQFVYGGTYLYFLTLIAGSVSAQLQINTARPGDPPRWTNVGAAKTADDTTGTSVVLAASAQVRVVLTGLNASSDVYLTLSRVPA